MILTKRKNGEVFNRGDMDALRGNLLSLGNHLQLMTKVLQFTTPKASTIYTQLW